MMNNNPKYCSHPSLAGFVTGKTILSAVMAVCLYLALPTGALAAKNWAGDVFNFQLTMAERGHAEAQYLLAGMYEDGHGTSRDMGLALKWYQEAAANGHGEARQRLERLSAGASL